VTVNDAEVSPAATVTLAGVVAPLPVAPRDTVAPPAGAGPFNVTVPTALAAPPITEPGVIVNESGTGGTMVNPAAADPLKSAVMSPEVATATAVVAIAKDLLVCPVVSVTVMGAVAAELALPRLTTMAAPTGSARLIETLPLTPVPPVTEEELRERVVTPTYRTTTFWLNASAPLDAVMVTVVSAVTSWLTRSKVAEDSPSATVTVAGTESAAGLLDERLTTQPPSGASPPGELCPSHSRNHPRGPCRRR
jgi:hypothetical protein